MTDKQPTTEQPTNELDRQPDQTDQTPNPHTADQRELWDRYREQQTRRSCPGCGDDSSPF